MKKIFILLLFLVLMFFVKEVEAVEESYYNLINMNQVQYNSTLGVFYSKQKINLTKDTNYTLVASSNFFGSALNSDSYALKNKNMGATFVDSKSNKLDLKFNLNVADTGLYYATITPTENCVLEFTDFLTRGYQLSTLPKSEILLFIGSKEEFKGFREVDYLDDYERISSTIDIYTGCDNPIKIEDITSKLKTYDNESGFSDNVVLVSDNYQNTNKIGEYLVVYKTKDSSNIESILTVNVKVVDATAPTITGPDVLEWDCYKEAPVPEIFKMYYKAYDNIDGDITNKIRVANSALAMYKLKVTKDYEIVLRVVDSAGNVGERTIILRAKDITPPTLTLADININLSSLGESVFDKFYDQVITEVSDDSGTYTTDIEAKELAGKMGFSGTYEVTVTATDAVGNKTVKTAIIRVIDDIAPEFYLHMDLINTTTSEVYTLEDIKEAISASLYEEGILYDSINLVSCDYISNEKNPGKYTVKYMYSYKGEANYMIGTITVSEPKTTPPFWLLTLLLIPLSFGVVQLIKKRKNL